MNDAAPPLPHDPAERAFLGELLRQRAEEWAASAARRLCGSCQLFAARWKPMPDLRWKDHLVARVRELAAAVEMGSPELFCLEVEWASRAFSCRGLPVGDLRDSLRTLREAVGPELDAADAVVLSVYFERALARLEALGSAGPESGAPGPGAGLASEAAAAYLQALIRGDRREACAAVTDAVRRGLSVRDAYTSVLGPVQREIGTLWHSGEMTVAEEHFATATTQTAMSQLLAMAPEAPRHGRTALVAAVDGNNHDLGARQVADFFEMDGWKTVYLGASVPTEELAGAAEQFGADVIGLSAALCVHLRALQEAVSSVRARVPQAWIIVGGPIFCSLPGLWRRLGADGSACDAPGAVAEARRLAGLALHGADSAGSA